MSFQSEAQERSSTGSKGAKQGGYEGMTENQQQLWDRLQVSNREWLGRFQAEAALTLEYVDKLTRSRSLSDAADAFQFWTVRHVELATEDGRRIMDDARRLMKAGTFLWTDLGEESGRMRGIMS